MYVWLFQQFVAVVYVLCPLHRQPSEAALFEVGPLTIAWLQQTELTKCFDDVRKKKKKQYNIYIYIYICIYIIPSLWVYLATNNAANEATTSKTTYVADHTSRL